MHYNSHEECDDGADVDNREPLVVDRFVLGRSDEGKVTESGDLRRRRDPDDGRRVKREEHQSADGLVRDREEVHAPADSQERADSV